MAVCLPCPQDLPPHLLLCTSRPWWVWVWSLFSLILYPDLGGWLLVPQLLGRAQYPAVSSDLCVWEGQDPRGPLVLSQQDPWSQVNVETEDTLHAGLALGKLLDSADTERGQARLACSRPYMKPGTVLLLCPEVPLALSTASYSCLRAFALSVPPLP